MALSPLIRLPASVFRKPGARVRLWGPLQARRTPSHAPTASQSPCFYSSSARSNASSHRTLFHSISSVRLPGLSVSPEYILPFSIRLKGNVGPKKTTKKTLPKAEDEEYSDEESADEGSELEGELREDPDVTKDYKDLEKAVPSFRYDVVLKTGLDVGRNKIEDAFYKGELRLNGEKLWKKSRTVKVGDTLDLLIQEEKEAETETVMRILLKKVLEEKTQSEKYRVVLRRWKSLKLPKKKPLK